MSVRPRRARRCGRRRAPEPPGGVERAVGRADGRARRRARAARRSIRRSAASCSAATSAPSPQAPTSPSSPRRRRSTLYENRRIDRWDAIRALRTPLVAAVSGYCLGGGCELAMAVRPRRRVGDRAVRPAGDQPRRAPGRRRYAAADARRRQGARDGRDPHRAASFRRDEALRAGLVARVVATRGVARRRRSESRARSPRRARSR